MRFAPIICAAVAAQAQQYDDDDLNFIRQLQSNSSNATTPAPTSSSAAPTSSSAAPTSSSAAPTSSSAAPTSTPAASILVNGTNISQIVVEVKSSVSMAPPVGMTVPTSTRRLRRLQTGAVNAYNYFCSAFSLTSSLNACNSMQTAGQIGTGKAFADLTACHVSLNNKVAGTNCHTTSTGKGACIENPTNPSRHRACTKHSEADADGKRTYTSDSSFTFPATVVAADNTIAAQADTAIAAAQTAVATGTTANMLKAFTLVAAQAIANDPAAAAAVNLTAAFGQSQSALQALTITTANVNTYAADPTAAGVSSINTAVQAAATANPSLNDATFSAIVVTVPATGDAPVMGVFSAAILAIASMLMM